MNTKPRNRAVYHLKYTNNQRYIKFILDFFPVKHKNLRDVLTCLFP